MVNGTVTAWSNLILVALVKLECVPYMGRSCKMMPLVLTQVQHHLTVTVPVTAWNNVIPVALLKLECYPHLHRSYKMML